MTPKLFVSDVDGTLVPEEANEVPEQVLDMVRAVTDRGMYFAVASGRPYQNLRALFAPVADRMLFLVENGGALFQNDEVCYTDPLDRDVAVALCRELQQRPDCEFLASGIDRCYVMPKSQAYQDHLSQRTHFTSVRMERYDELPETVLKVAACCDGSAQERFPAFHKRWGEKVTVCVSGARWIDFTVAQKGKGLAAICRRLDIPMSETIAFGDNWNDLSMLKSAGLGYIKADSDPELRRQIANSCASVPEQVEKLLAKREIIEKPLAFLGTV